MKTQNKLDEIKYYVDKIKNSKNEEELQFSLSAFFSSARSVTWVLQKEFSKNEAFKRWYSKKQKEMKNDSYLVSLIQKRNWSEKEGWTGPESQLLDDVFIPNNSRDSAIVKTKFSPRKWFLHRIQGDTAFFEDVIEYSKTVYNKLKKIVDEAYKVNSITKNNKILFQN